MRPTDLTQHRLAVVALLFAGILAAACDRDTSSDATGTTATRRSALAVTPPTQTQDVVGAYYRASDIGPAPGLPAAPSQQISRAPAVAAASQHPGHFANKVVNKPAPSAQAANAPAAVDPDVLGKQSAYLQQWEAMRPSVAGLPAAEQERRRADLKQQVMGF